MRFAELVGFLDAQADPVGRAHELLPRLLGSEAELAALVRAAGAGQLERTRRVRVKDVEPTVWPLLSRPGHYDVVLNVYDPARCDQLWRAGSITPHRHHFSFASVVLGGGLVHFTYDNLSRPDEPVLRPRAHESLTRGDRLRLDWRDYHLVLSPRPRTVTCMIRGAPVFTNPFLDDDGYTADRLAADQAALLTALSAAARPAALAGGSAE